MKTRKKGIIFFAVVAGIMLSSGVTIAINPAQWFGDSSDFDEITAEELDAFDLDTLGLELGYSDDESLQFCSANEQARSNEYVKNTKYLSMYTATCNYGGSLWHGVVCTNKYWKSCKI